MSTTVGIDLAAEPKGTAIAAISWQDGAAVVETLLTGCSDDIVLHWMHHPSSAVGIDCPFGWPAMFVDLVSQQAIATTFERLAQGGATNVVVLHELGAFAPFIDRAVVLREGRIVYDGTPQGVHPRPDAHAH